MYTTVIDKRDNPGCLIQVLWFALVGWWLGQIWIAVAWFLMVTIVGIPLGVMMLNKLPQVIALRGEAHRVAVSTRGDGTLTQREISVPETDMLVRALHSHRDRLVAERTVDGSRVCDLLDGDRPAGGFLDV